MNTQWFNIIGLALDIIGVILLFAYGLPTKIKLEDGQFLKMGSSSITEYENKRVKRKNFRIRFWSNFGLVIIMIGFILQIFSSVSNIYKSPSCCKKHSNQTNK